jgi:hypothetical protein
MYKMSTAALTVVLTVVLFLGCLNSPEETTSTTLGRVTPTTQTGQPTTTTLNKNVVDFKKAVSSSDVTQCDTIQDTRLKDICVRDIAVAKGDTAMCARVSAVSLKDLCYYKIALTKKDVSLCSSIQTAQIKTTCETKAR